MSTSTLAHTEAKRPAKDASKESNEDLLSNDELTLLIKNSSFAVPFSHDERSDLKIRDVNSYFRVVADVWPWLERAYMAAKVAGPAKVDSTSIPPISVPDSATTGLPPTFNIKALLEDKYVKLAASPLFTLASANAVQLNAVSSPCLLLGCSVNFHLTPTVRLFPSMQYNDMFCITAVFREAIEELLPNIRNRQWFPTLDARVTKSNDKITVRTKAAQLAKIRISRDYARCKVVSVIIQAIQRNNFAFTSPAEQVELPAEWLGSTIVFKFEDNNLSRPTECSRPELKHHPYHNFLLMQIESSLRSAVHGSAASGSRKKQRMSSSNAFVAEVHSPLMKDSIAKLAPQKFLETSTVDASKLELLKSIDTTPNFETLCNNMCVTYDLLEVAAIRMKAMTAVTLNFKHTLAQANSIIARLS